MVIRFLPFLYITFVCCPSVLGPEERAVQADSKDTLLGAGKCSVKYCGPQVGESMVTDSSPKGSRVLLCILVLVLIFRALSAPCSFSGT